MATVKLDNQVPPQLSGRRLDQVLVRLFPEYSRMQHQNWIRNGQVTVDGKQLRPKDCVQNGQNIKIRAELTAKTADKAQNIPINICHQDQTLLVIDKPAGLVVHPGAGNPDHTLVNALLHFDPGLKKLPRAGIIHRLDKETSGLLIVARNVQTYQALVLAMQAREIKREYESIVQGHLISGSSIERPIGRHPRLRTQMAVVASGKPAVTHYRIIERFQAHTHIRIQLETGRTHQIRVHFSDIGYPIIGDQTYLKQLRFPKNMAESIRKAVKTFPRQALHATKLELLHPISGKLLALKSPLPKNMQLLLHILRNAT